MSKPLRRVMTKPVPLTFSDLHGKGIALSNNSRCATRSSGFGDAIIFSSRTVRSFEKVFLRHRQKDVDWIGSLRVGFCMPDPKLQFTQETLPSLAFKHLTDAAGYWLRACSDELLRTSPIIYVYYSFDGQIFIGGYGQTTPPQAVLTINEHNGPYYLLCEVYGRTDQIEIIDPDTLPDQTLVNDNFTISIHSSIFDYVNKRLNSNSNLFKLHHFDYLFNSNVTHRLNFYPTTKHNVNFSHNFRIVYVNDLRKTSSYAFPNVKMKLNDILLCKILNCDTNTSSTILFGLTTCNPTVLQEENLPNETNKLYEHYSSYQWFIDHDLHVNLTLYDELAFWFEKNGHVYLSINNKPPIQLKIQLPFNEINDNIQFYPFFDLYGQITSICLYDLNIQKNLDFTKQKDKRDICSICCENLANARLVPCLCVICSECATQIKRPTLFSECPFDRKHITQIQQLF